MMQIASILSDLTSLRVCDPSAALTLVSVYKHERVSSSTAAAASDHGELGVMKAAADSEGENQDPDMQRAMDLVELHYGVKMKHVQEGGGEDAALREARRRVDGVLEKLGKRKS